MPTPKVSIITATYNWSSVLKYAIQSVLWQSFQDFEHLIIGDACTDDSAEVVTSFNDPRLRWHNLAQNSGSQSVPNNVGIEMARGKYIAYLGHDDVWHPSHLEALIKAMEHDSSENADNTDNADLACAITAWVGAPGTDIRLVSGLGPNREIHGKPPPSSIMHRRDVVEQTGLWKDYRTLHGMPDQEFINRIWEYRGRFATSGKLTVYKFPSSWRKNSYRDRRSDEQAEYIRRIQFEPDFLEKEWHAIVMAFVANKNFVPKFHPPRGAAPGWIVEQFRKARGLEAQPALPALAAPITELSPVKRLTNWIKRFLRRVLEKLLRMLKEN